MKPPPDKAFVVVPVTMMIRFVPSQRSSAPGRSKTKALLQARLRLGGQGKWGGVVSMTVTVWLQMFELPHGSVALQVRVAENVFPQSGLVTVLRTWIRTLVPEQKSKAVGRMNRHGVPHSTVRLEPQVMTGGIVSTIVTVC